MCKYCNKILAKADSLQSHMDLVHDVNSHVRLCEMCGKSFSGSYIMRVHMQRHAGRTWDCRYCDSQFHSIVHRLRHERIHTGDKPYVCEYCSRGFRSSMNLKLHIRTHTGEKPYRCDMCGAGFAPRNNMTSHKARCSGHVKSSKS